MAIDYSPCDNFVLSTHYKTVTEYTDSQVIDGTRYAVCYVNPKDIAEGTLVTQAPTNDAEGLEPDALAVILRYDETMPDGLAFYIVNDMDDSEWGSTVYFFMETAEGDFQTVRSIMAQGYQNVINYLDLYYMYRLTWMPDLLGDGAYAWFLTQ